MNYNRYLKWIYLYYIGGLNQILFMPLKLLLLLYKLQVTYKVVDFLYIHF